MNQILKSLLAIQRGIHETGVGKLRTNTEQKFKFRGIDDALYAFAPLLTQHGVLLTPRYHDIIVTPRQTKSGGTTFNVQMQGTFTFTSAEDGSFHTVGPFYGEANDGQDKAISKAESIALRQMFFHTFTVPHEPVIGGDPDGQGEEEAGPDYSAWFDAISDAESMDELNRLAGELKAAALSGVALRNVRARWSARAKELQAVPA